MAELMVWLLVNKHESELLSVPVWRLARWSWLVWSMAVILMRQVGRDPGHKGAIVSAGKQKLECFPSSPNVSNQAGCNNYLTQSGQGIREFIILNERGHTEDDRQTQGGGRKSHGL